MPLGGALVELVEDRLRLVDLALADIGVHLRIGAAHVVRGVPLAALGHDLVVRDLDPVEHARSFVARLPFEKAVLRILLFQLFVARGDFFVRRGLGNTEYIVIFSAHFLFLPALAVTGGWVRALPCTRTSRAASPRACRGV